MNLPNPLIQAAEYVYRVARNAVGFWLEANAVSYAGALAFFTLFSIAPVVILAVQVIGPYLEDRTVLAFAAALERLVEPLPQAPLAAPA